MLPQAKDQPESPKIIRAEDKKADSPVKRGYNNPQMTKNDSGPKLMAKPRGMDEAALNDMLAHVGVKSRDASPNK